MQRKSEYIGELPQNKREISAIVLKRICLQTQQKIFLGWAGYCQYSQIMIEKDRI